MFRGVEHKLSLQYGGSLQTWTLTIDPSEHLIHPFFLYPLKCLAMTQKHLEVIIKLPWCVSLKTQRAPKSEACKNPKYSQYMRTRYFMKYFRPLFDKDSMLGFWHIFIYFSSLLAFIGLSGVDEPNWGVCMWKQHSFLPPWRKLLPGIRWGACANDFFVSLKNRCYCLTDLTIESLINFYLIYICIYLFLNWQFGQSLINYCA